MNFKRYILLYTIVPLFILTVAACYYRFVVLQDYIVTYEHDCDPFVSTCYIGCEDEECTEEYYFKYVTRYAPNIRALCGTDITDCAAAGFCPVSEKTCSVDFCDTDTEECEELDAQDEFFDAEEVSEFENES